MDPPTFALITTDRTIEPILQQALSGYPNTLLTAQTTEEALRLISRQQDLVLAICDDEGGRIECDKLLVRAKQAQPPIPVIILGAVDSAKAATDAIHRGACDYLPKPLTAEALHQAILGTQSRQPEIPPSSPDLLQGFQKIVSVSPQMQLLKRLAAEVAATDATVLITGESGTGKELFARAIHMESSRARGPFIALNCAGIPEHLLESELFGYQRGAFTDAKQAKPGRFQLAEGGTLFLDEVGEMSLTAQAKLLRVLEDHVIDPLGSTHSVKVNIRVIAATNEDLPSQIKAGRFRLDLFYRLNVYQLRIPPLRERPEDIEPILHSFLDTARRSQGCRIQSITPEALTLFQRHDWPGNVRELHNVVEGLTITCKDTQIRPEHVPPTFRMTQPKPPAAPTEKPSLLAFGLSFQEMEKKMLEEALRKSGGNVSEASRLLKITRNTLRYRMAKYNIQ
ncbi:sigma 54-interacting transcriptional regulator [Petrachloros mirabilis]